MGHSNEWHIKEGDSLERTDAGVRAYFHDAMEAMEHGLTASEFRMREMMPVDETGNQSAHGRKLLA